MKKLIGLAAVVFTAVAANAATNYLFWTISVPGSFPNSTLPRAINNENVIAGSYEDTNAVWHGFTYDVIKNVWVYPIDYPSSPGTFATAINDSGEVAGYLETNASGTLGMLDSGGNLSLELVWCNWGVNVQTYGLNNSGYTAGACQPSDLMGGGSLSWVWAQGNAVVFSCPYSAAMSGANDINNKGQVVGWYAFDSVNGAYLADYSSCISAVLFPGAASTNLTGINDDGWAIGTASFSNGPPVGFLYNTSTNQFTPITPPSAAVNGVVTAGLNNNNLWVGCYFDKNNNVVGFYTTHPLVIIGL